MKKVILAMACLMAVMSVKAENIGVPGECEDVMLQAFYWNSHTKMKYGGKSTKWSRLLPDTTELCENFDLIWFPPATSGGGVGYYPSSYSSFSGSAWGSKSELQSLLKALKRGGCHPIADMVLNHHASSSGWTGFSTENFGDYGTFTLTSVHVCKGDEAFTDAKSDSRGKQSGAADTGTNDEGCRDLDHTNPYVQDLCKAYCKTMLEKIGFEGFRYDMTKGYSGEYVSMYNEASKPYFSVGECWDGIGVIKNYLAKANYNTLSFDFPLKYAIHGIASHNYSSLRTAGLRSSGLSRYAVTFIDNHDTFERDDNQGGEYISYNVDISTKRASIVRANAFILMMPGVPCVFYPHWVTFKDDIKELIAIRRLAGIHSESEVKDEKATSTTYEATIVGHRGNVILRMGSASKRNMTVPEGYVLVYNGLDDKGYTIGADIYVSESLVTGWKDVQTESGKVEKAFENGQVVIKRGEERYDVLGRKL